MSAIDAGCLDELASKGCPDELAARISADVSRSVSGVGFWPRLVLDEAETLVVESRGVDGSAQRSHWQTVLPLLSASPERVSAGDVLHVEATIDLGDAIDVPVRYELHATVVAGGAASAL